MTELDTHSSLEEDAYWRVANANRVAVMIDAAAYFGALRKALLKAERSIVIVGWDIDSRMELRGEDDPEDGAPLALRDFLVHLVERRPRLRIHLMLWDYSVVFAPEREPLPSLSLRWTTPRRIRVCLDDVLPLGASHHQKIVVIDDCIAFSGGLDLTIRRWDTPAHAPDESARTDPQGRSYEPFHDVQMCVDDAAAQALGALVRDRWLEAAGERIAPAVSQIDCWPDDLVPDVTDVAVGISRTMPAIGDRDDVREVEESYLAAIGQAERFIYIENQHYTAERIADALVRRLREVPQLEVVLVAPRSYDGWFESQSMTAGRMRFMRKLNDAGLADRTRMVYPSIADDHTAITVHSKVMIVDDRLLRVGSANLNNRSMGMDSECDLSIAARTDAQRHAVAAVRNRLMGEHLGTQPEEVAAAIEREGSIVKVVDTLGREGRALRLVEDAGADDDQIAQTIGALADPERPIESTRLMGDMFGGRPQNLVLRRLLEIAALSAVLVALILVWQLTPLQALADVDTLRPWFQNIAASPYAFVAVPLIYVLAGLAVVPVSVLIVATAAVFGPVEGIAYALGGSLLSAVVTYGLGAIAGRGFLRDLIGYRLNRVSRALARKGVLSVLALRFVPIAPFTFVNLAAGVSHIAFRDYVLGTILGMAPGIVVMSALGHQLRRVLVDPQMTDVAVLVLVILLWLVTSIGLQMLVERMRATQSG